MSFLRNPKLIVLSVGAVAACLCVVSWELGRRVGIREGMQDSFYGHKLHADQELTALQNLQKNNLEAIRSNLETALGLSVSMLATDERLALMAEKTRADVTGTLVKIKNYRKLNPYSGANPGYTQFVDKQLKWVPEK